MVLASQRMRLASCGSTFKVNSLSSPRRCGTCAVSTRGADVLDFEPAPARRLNSAAARAAKAGRAAAECSIQLLTASKSVLTVKVGLLSRPLGELEGEVARIRQEGEDKVEDVLSERDGLQVRPSSTAS